MSQDIVSDALNQIMNARRIGKGSIVLKKHSRLLLGVLAIAKLKGYIKNYKAGNNELKIEIGDLLKCNAIKPRFVVSVKNIEKYARRYLPGKGLGILIISTPQGLMTHQTAVDKNIGGSLIAYFY